MHDGAPVLVQVFDRVLDREDVARPGHVDRVDQRGHARRLPRTRRPAEEDEPLLELDELSHRLRQPDLVERRNCVLDESQRHRREAPLVEGVAAEPVGAEREGEVDIAVAFEVLTLRALEQVGEVVVHERLVDRPETLRPVASPRRGGSSGASDRQNQVGARDVDDGVERRAKGLVDLHRRKAIGAPDRRERRAGPSAGLSPGGGSSAHGIEFSAASNSSVSGAPEPSTSWAPYHQKYPPQ